MSNRIAPAVSVDGANLVSQKIVQVIEAIREYNPELNVEWIPPTARRAGQAAFRITHSPPGAEPYVIFHVQTEEEFDARVLKRVIYNDASVNGQPRYNEIEAAEEAAKRVAHQIWMDELEEKSEMAHALMKTDKSVYKFNKDLIFREGTPGNVAHEFRPKVL